MSQYKTIRNFWDIELPTEEYPKGKLYTKGDIYPAEGIEVSQERLKELSTYNNRAGEIFIKLVDEEKNISDTLESEEAFEEKPKRGRKRKED